MSETGLANTPALSWFAPPEGVHTLVQSLNVTSSATAHFVASLAVPQTPTLQVNANNGTESPQYPPPQFSTRMAVAQVQFPHPGSSAQATSATGTLTSTQAAGGGQIHAGLGLGGLRSAGSNGNVLARKDSAGATEGIPFSSQGNSHGALQGDLSQDGNSGTNGGGQANLDRHSSFSPLMKRRPLTSSFSIPTLGSLGSAGQSSTNGAIGPDTAPSTSRPSRQFRGTSSSFVRSWEGIPQSNQQLKSIAEANAGKAIVFGFWTQSKSVVWSEIMPSRPKEALARVVFSAAPTCVDVNQHTAAYNQIDVLVGFNTGDIFWFDPLSAKYTRLNKAGVITSSPVTSIMWLPPSPNYSGNENHSNLFLSSHADGTMLVWDKDREDWSGFTPQPVPTGPLGTRLAAPPTPGKENDASTSLLFTTNKPFSGDVSDLKKHRQSVPMGDIIVSRPQVVDKKGQQGAAKYNPVSHWRVSRRPVTAFAFSPDLQLCAAVSEDGCLRIINTAEEKLLDTFQSYFGSLTCVAWSPDGRFVVTGGQDDLCTIYAPLEQRIVAQCHGHGSWVTGVAWDPWRSDDRTMRFASVGEDCKLIFWDLSSAALTRPKAHAHHGPRRHSLTSQRDSMFHLPISSTERTDPIFHPAPHRDDVAMLQPVMVKTLSNDIFSGLMFLPQHLITLSRSGQIKMWDRPPDEEDGLLGMKSEFRSSIVALDRRAR
ncbi:hypothetical protein OIV83_001401 [Microbotryomycetes sp. JL201]|nr:hypothetical protein OIV83_001401 [Microbotryomycetes sp. JL201]